MKSTKKKQFFLPFQASFSLHTYYQYPQNIMQNFMHYLWIFVYIHRFVLCACVFIHIFLEIKGYITHCYLIGFFSQSSVTCISFLNTTFNSASFSHWEIFHVMVAEMIYVTSALMTNSDAHLSCFLLDSYYKAEIVSCVC